MSTEPIVPSRRRRGVRLVVALIVLFVLLVVAAVVGDGFARRAVADSTATQIRDVLGLDATHPVAVTVGGWAVLPQLIAGRLDRLDIEADDVALGGLNADVTAHATGVPISGAGELESAHVDAAIDAASVESLVAEFSNGTVDDVTLDPPAVQLETDIDVFGLSLAVGVGLVPDAVDGEIALEPESIRLGGATITADDLRDRVGSLADGLVRTRTICLDDALPVGLTLRSVEVRSQTLRAGFDVAPGMLADPTLQEPGSCG
ncbi:DUF2993 domain-containing protein [Microbacteriaceae bacterium VKM Ac-2855]|nr:DUF2993 domain-containing protein [Microbacteriaceae bacterium VKM Ac-2855]